MTVKVLFFSVLQDLTGTDELVWELPSAPPPSVADLWSALVTAHPPLTSWTGRVLIAVDHVFASPALLITDGQEIAFMPPVQGG
jgi:sulfur-carrier protein